MPQILSRIVHGTMCRMIQVQKRLLPYSLLVTLNFAPSKGDKPIRMYTNCMHNFHLMQPTHSFCSPQIKKCYFLMNGKGKGKEKEQERETLTSTVRVARPWLVLPTTPCTKLVHVDITLFGRGCEFHGLKVMMPKSVDFRVFFANFRLVEVPI